MTTGPLYSAATMMMARARLSELVDLLNRRIGAGGVTDLEHRVLYLATKAVELMSTDPRVVNERHKGKLYNQLSKFAVLGSSGTGVIAAASIFDTGSDWTRLTLRKGTADEKRERVLARTTDFAHELWTQLSRRAGEDTGKKARYRAYVLGYLCHIAAETITSPFLEHRPHFDDGLMVPEGMETSRRNQLTVLDVPVGVDGLNLDPHSTDEWQALSALWPSPGDVSSELWAAFTEAFQNVYGAAPPPSPDYARTTVSATRVPLSESLLGGGYEFYYHGVLGFRYGFDFWHSAWFAVPAACAFGTTLALAPAFYRLRRTFGEWPWSMPLPPESSDTLDGVQKVALSDVFAYPVSMTGPLALFYSIVAMAYTSRSAGGLNGWALASSIVMFLCSIGYWITTGVDPKEKDFGVGWRWGLFVALPLLGPFIFFIVGLVKHGTAIGGLAFLHAVPFFFFAVCMLFAWAVFLPLGKWAKSDLHADTTGLIVEYVILAVIAAILVIVLWVFAAGWIRNWILPEMAGAEFRSRLARVRHQNARLNQTSFVRLYDDDLLLRRGASNPNIAFEDAYFPPSNEALLSLRWSPEPGSSGDLYVRQTRAALLFRDGSAASANEIALPIPLGGVTAGQWVDALNAQPPITVGTVIARLHAELDDPSQRDRVLLLGTPFWEREELESASLLARTTDPPPNLDDFDLNADVRLPATFYSASRVEVGMFHGRGGPAYAGFTPGEGTVVTDGTSEASTVTGTGTRFTEQFIPGDPIAIDGQISYVTSVSSSEQTLSVSPGISPRIRTDRPYARPARESVYRLLGGWAGGGAQDSILHNAADLAAILCMAMVPRLAPGGTISGVSSTTGGAAVRDVSEVFRNWNLDRRRVNEWRTIVSGRAAPEDAADAGAYGPAPAATTRRDGLPEWRKEAAGWADRFGWIPTLRHFVDLVGRQTDLTATTPPAPATNPELTPNRVAKALAHMLDLPDPEVV